MKRVLIFNAPPSSGKDEAVKILKGVYNTRTTHPHDYPWVHHKEFKAKLISLTQSIYDIGDYVWQEWYTTKGKEEPRAELGGISARQALIKVSETVIKPNFGKMYFGESAAKNLEDWGVNVFSDGGFAEELEPIYKVTEGNMMIVRIHRPGYTFKGDSRSYIESFKDVDMVDIYNEGTLEDFKESVLSVYDIFQNFSKP